LVNKPPRREREKKRRGSQKTGSKKTRKTVGVKQKRSSLGSVGLGGKTANQSFARKKTGDKGQRKWECGEKAKDFATLKGEVKGFVESTQRGRATT